MFLMDVIEDGSTRMFETVQKAFSALEDSLTMKPFSDIKSFYPTCFVAIFSISKLKRSQP